MHVHVHGCMTLQNKLDATVNQWTTRHNTNVQLLQLVKRHNLLENIKKRLWVFLGCPEFLEDQYLGIPARCSDWSEDIRKQRPRSGPASGEGRVSERVTEAG